MAENEGGRAGRHSKHNQKYELRKTKEEVGVRNLLYRRIVINSTVSTTRVDDVSEWK
jgi:hypothetical protein